MLWQKGKGGREDEVARDSQRRKGYYHRGREVILKRRNKGSARANKQSQGGNSDDQEGSGAEQR